MTVNRKRPKFSMTITGGLTNVVVYNRHAAGWGCSSIAAFSDISITSVGILAPMMTIIHSYTKTDKKHHFPKDGETRGTH